MTPAQFIDKWSRTALTERQAAQSHFIDLCHVLGEPTPSDADPAGDWYTFEKGVSKIDGAGGFADVWMRGHFGWEYKKDRANLDRAYAQLQLYAVALENPPLLVVADTKQFRIYTNWTNTVQERHDIALEDLAKPATLDLLRDVFRAPDKLKPEKTREQVTQEAAKEFVTIAERLRMTGHPPEQVAHFLNRLVFCLFAEDVNLLPDDLFKRLLDTLAKRRDEVPARSQRMLSDLFREMRGGGEYGIEHILHFNGGLFDDDTALPLDADSLDILRRVARQDWSAIDPSIFGTLFERFLDPDKRAQIGAHYTDPGKIMLIVEPVIVRPLTAEWEAVKKELADILARSRGKPSKAVLDRAEARLDVFLKRLADVRILDPACGSGNFLFLALQALKDLERRVIVEAHAMGLALRVLHCGPENVKGIEINQYAAELARTSIWIGDIQWKRRNGFEAKDEPVLRPLDAIECRDALVVPVETYAPLPSPLVGEGGEARSAEPGEGLAIAKSSEEAPSPASRTASARHPPLARGATRARPQGERGSVRYVEAEWPEAEFIIGNPPFLGGKLMRSGLGDDYVETLFEIYGRRVPPEADLVCYWFEKARAQWQLGRVKRIGLVSTNSIRGGANRRVLDRISEQTRIFEAWADEPWIVDGAAVRVSIVCFGTGEDHPRLDDIAVSQINPDLTSGTLDFTQVRPLAENLGVAFMGDTKGGAFDIPGELARGWLLLPINPNGRSNAEVLKPWRNGMDITRRPSDKWIIDFGWEMSERDASLFEAPYDYVKEHVSPERSRNRRSSYKKFWWRHVESRPAMWAALLGVVRYLATPTVAKHRLFVWLDCRVCPDHQLIAIARDDDTTFGILHSRFHEAWSLRLGTWLGVGNDPRYTPTTTFETFPFPSGLTPNIPAKDYADDSRAVAIAQAAKRLDDLRNAWLNPPDLIDIVPEVYPTADALAAGAAKIYPDRILPKTEAAAAELKKRTLTNLYNQRPQWLADAHRDLDAAVAAAYGWPANISEEDALAKLLDLNLSRAGRGPTATTGIEESEADVEGPVIGRKAFAKISL
jgi:type II restriction/modification system DNA methylase subunit YeeA